jgi:fimbrial chaperone protein
MINFRHVPLLLLAAISGLLAAVPNVRAMAVEPMVLDMTASGKAARHAFKVSNPGTKVLPVDIAILSLELGQNGEQMTKKAAEDFLVFPVQAMIPPGGSQVFRVQWIGEPDLAKSRTYRFDVGQLPVQTPKGTNGIQILMSFGVTVNVAPLQGKSDIKVMSAAPIVGKDGRRLATLTVQNPGNSYAYLKQSEIQISGRGWSAQMTPGEIAQKVGLGIVQPGKQRRFVLPVEVPASVQSIEAKVTLRPPGN